MFLFNFLEHLGYPDSCHHYIPTTTSFGSLRSLDLAGMKVSVVQKRAEWKDYADIAALIYHDISLETALSAAGVIYKDQFNPQIALEALSFFDDIEGVSENVKSCIKSAVRAVDLRNLPDLGNQLP